MASYVKSEIDINQSAISHWSQRIVPVLKFLVWFLPIFIYIGLFIAGTVSLVFFFIWALLVWLILVLVKRSSGYMHAYRVTIHAMTLVLILGLLSPVTSLNMYTKGFLLIVIVLLNFFNHKNTVEVEVVKSVVAPENKV
jgi:hypothetical protein